MSSTLSVIALVTRLRSSSHTTNGDAEYREKISNINHTFSFKQFVNSRHEYNEAFKEGDLVFFAGKFTVDEQKLLVNDFLLFLLLLKKKSDSCKKNYLSFFV